jgi:hypothetical protein
MATQYTAGLSSGQVLTAATMNSIGATSDTWTPTFSGFTLGNGSVIARYIQIQKLVYCQMEIMCGSTTAFTGVFNMSFPKTARISYSNWPLGMAWMFDSSLGNQIYGPVSGVSTTGGMMNIFNSGPADLGITYTNVGTPFTIGNNDVFYLVWTYEAA